jgi:hypothetical protein
MIMHSVAEKTSKTRFFSVIAIILFLFTGCSNSPKATDSSTGDAVPVPKEGIRADTSIITRTATREELDRLKGKWQRTDGGYVIEIFSLDDAGNINAGYFNPNPINVEKSQWIFREGIIYIRVILRDVNYPGSTYTLEYKSDNDYLMGNYYQAVEAANYDVIFTRKK